MVGDQGDFSHKNVSDVVCNLTVYIIEKIHVSETFTVSFKE